MDAAKIMVGHSSTRDARAVDDRVLVERVRQGDASAYDLLVRRYVSRAMAIARRLLGNIEDAEDLVQDVFMRALNRLDTFDESRAFAPWFFRLLINAGINARKARAVRVTESEREDIPSREATPYDMAARHEIRDRFRAALTALPPRQRLVISMFEVDGLSTAEIAATLGISRETVRWHHHQARHALRNALAAFRD